MSRDLIKNESMREESKTKIINAATKLFISKGYYNVKIKDIANEANISVGRIYWYYSNKEDVLKEILSEGFYYQSNMLNEISEYNGTRDEKIRILITKYLELSRNNTEFIQIMMSVMAGGSTDLLLELGFNTKEIGMKYHLLLHNILCLDENISNEAAHGTCMMFFSLFYGMITIYGNDWHHIPDEFFIKKLTQILIE